MKHTLTLTGSSAALAAAMRAFDEAESGNAPTAAPSMPETQTASTSTGTGTTASPPSSVAPIPPVPTPPSGTDDEEDEDESGGESDGTGVDADGLPWDERIHTSTKTKTAKGTWTKRRGGPKGAELAQIEAELRGSTAHGHPNSVEVSHVDPAPSVAPAPTEQPAAPPQPIPAPVPPTPQPIPAPTPAVEQPATPAMPAAAASATPPAAPAPVAQAPAEAIAASMDFPSFMQQVGPKMGDGAGQIDAAYLAQVCQMYGLNAITDLALKPEMIGQIVAQFQADGRW